MVVLPAPAQVRRAVGDPERRAPACRCRVRRRCGSTCSSPAPPVRRAGRPVPPPSSASCDPRSAMRPGGLDRTHAAELLAARRPPRRRTPRRPAPRPGAKVSTSAKCRLSVPGRSPSGRRRHARRRAPSGARWHQHERARAPASSHLAADATRGRGCPRARSTIAEGRVRVESRPAAAFDAARRRTSRRRVEPIVDGASSTSGSGCSPPSGPASSRAGASPDPPETASRDRRAAPLVGADMDRLSGLDASFLYLETPAQLMHVCGLIVLDPSTMPEPYTFAGAARRHRRAGPRRTRLHPQAAPGPARARPPGLGARPAVRHRAARAPARAAHARWVRRAHRAGEPPRRSAAGPLPPALGDVGDRGLHEPRRPRPDRGLLEDAPRDRGRRLRGEPRLAPVQPRARRRAAGRRPSRRAGRTSPAGPSCSAARC